MTILPLPFTAGTTQNHGTIMMGIIGKLLVFVMRFYHWLVDNILLLITLACTVDMAFAVHRVSAKTSGNRVVPPYVVKRLFYVP